jgi:RNA polymerase sigma-70 factor (ECF subfamily)
MSIAEYQSQRLYVGDLVQTIRCSQRQRGKKSSTFGVLFTGACSSQVSQGSNVWKHESQRRAFEEVAAEHLDALYRTALRYMRGDAAAAEDLVQDTMIKALDAWPTLREPERAKAWLFRILSRLHLNRLRHASRHPETAAADVGEAELEQALSDWTPGVDPESLAIGEAGLERVIEALDRLPSAWSRIFWLIEVEGFGYREVAELLGIAEGTVASSLSRARAALRSSLTNARERRSSR